MDLIFVLSESQTKLIQDRLTWVIGQIKNHYPKEARALELLHTQLGGLEILTGYNVTMDDVRSMIRTLHGGAAPVAVHVSAPVIPAKPVVLKPVLANSKPVMPTLKPAGLSSNTIRPILTKTPIKPRL